MSACPSESFVAIESAALDEAATKSRLICKENVTVDRRTVQDLVSRGDCASWYIQSTPGNAPLQITPLSIFTRSIYGEMGFIIL